MKCVTGNIAHFVCINRECEMRNAYVCSNPDDGCKANHEPCSLISLSYLLKKTRSESSSKSQENKFSKLVPMYDKARSIATTINLALVSANFVREINMMLEDGGPLSAEDKEKITKFMSDSKLNNSDENVNLKLEKELDEFMSIVADFQASMKQTKNREIQELKKRLDREERMRETFPSQMPMPVQSRMMEASQIKMKPLPVESRVESFRQKQAEMEQQMKSGKKPNGPSPVKGRSEVKKKEKEKGFGFESKLETIVKNHIPKGPLFSKITNDIGTLNTFFNEKFQTAHLLYRASENNYLVNKFHEKCDGHKFTLVIVLTEFDKIIGGYTPIPWRGGGGQWYEDPECESFLFNLTSGEKYPLKEKQKAIWCSKTYGPSFGHPDLEIADKALHNSNSCANFPSCYNNGNYTNSTGSTQLFCGTKNGHFRIKEWEVYQLTFP